VASTFILAFATKDMVDILCIQKGIPIDICQIAVQGPHEFELTASINGAAPLIAMELLPGEPLRAVEVVVQWHAGRLDEWGGLP
jgi:hypothetical protein